MHRSILPTLLAGPSLFVLAAVATAQPASRSADPATVAQQANEAAEEANDEGAIIVTARRRAESLLDVPQTVQAVTGKQLEEYNILKFEDITQLVPGLTLTAPTSGIGVGASVRGTTFSVNSQGTPTVEVYINEHPVQSSLMFQAQFDVGQIEVLKGPQGTQRGRSSPSGAMTLSTRRPDLDEIGGAVNFVGTSRHGINIQAALNVPIIQDVLAIRVAGLLDRNDELGVVSATTGQHPDFRTQAFRASLRFEPTDSLSAVVMYQRLERRSSTYGGVLFGPGATGSNQAATTGALTQNLVVTNFPAQGCTTATPCNFTLILPGGRPAISAPANFNGPALTPEDYMSVQDFPSLTGWDTDVATAQIDWGFSGQKLTYVGGFSRTHLDSTGGGGDATNTVVGRQSGPLHIGNVSTERRFTNELRLSSEERLFGTLDYTIGVYRGKEWGGTSSPTSTLYAGAFGSPLGASAPTGAGVLTPYTFSDRYGLDSDRVSTRKNIEKAAFANVLAHLFDDKLELEAGGRFIWYSATKSQITEFGRGLMAVRNPNATALNPNAACPATLSGVNNSGATFLNAAVLGSTYRGTCDVQMTLNTTANPFGGIRPSTLDQALQTRKWSPFVYKLSASYHFTPDLMAYATWGTAWRPGPGPITGAVICAAANDADGGEAHPNPLLCDQYNFLEPDKAKSIELGFKGAFLDNRLSFSVAAFKQKFDGFFVFGSGFALQGTCIYPHIKGVTLQPTSGCTAGTAIVTYNAPVDSKGIDADFSFRVSDEFNFGGAFSWATSKFTGGAIPCGDNNFDGIPDSATTNPSNATEYLNRWPGATGTRVGASAFGVALCDAGEVPTLKPNQSPKWNANLRAEYSHEVFTGGEGFIRALYNYTPKNKNLNPVTTFVPKPYGLLSLFLGLRADDGSWEVSLAGRNILNKKTILTRAQTQSALTRPPGASTDTLSFVLPATGTTGNLSGYTTIGFVQRREFQLSARFAFGSR